VAAEIRAEMARQMPRRKGVDLAKVLDVSEGTVRNKLSGASSFDLIEFERVAEWLGLDPVELIARVERAAA
jgi:hypothetical protein